jgi:hypothetical protein
VRYRYVDPAGHMTFAYAFLAYLRDAKMRPVGERAQYKIRVVERGLPCDVVRDGDAAKARLLCRADARGRILERERFRCRNVEQRQRLQIERGLIRRRFRIRTDDRIPRVAQTDAAAVALDPLVPVAGNDPSLEHQALGLSETLLDTREQGRGVEEERADQNPLKLPPTPRTTEGRTPDQGPLFHGVRASGGGALH